MSDRRLPTLADIPHQIRAQLAQLPTQWRTWREGFRDDPWAFWRSPFTRIPLYIALGAAVLATLTWGTKLLVPNIPGQFQHATPWATLYVACTNPACQATYSTQQAKDFDQWPLVCEKCGQPTVYRAQRCPECRHWFAVAPGQPHACPFCAARKAAQQPKEPLRRPSATGDDVEDPW
jgi:hypothetical protein